MTPADLARVEALRDRCGPRTSASEAVRAALAWFTARASQIEDVTPAADQLVTEAGEPGGKVWGISLTESEALALDDLVAKPPAGLRRKFSRNEAVRLSVLLCSAASDDEIRAADAATARLVRGRSKKPPA